MQGLEKILEEINQEKLKHWDPSERLEADKLIRWCFDKCTDIIRKHMADDPDGWIPVDRGRVSLRRTDMQELEKILEEIDDLPVITDMDDGCLLKYVDVEDIIRKHMNDGWIPVERELPPNAKYKGALCPRYQLDTKYGVTEGWYNPDLESWFVLVWFMTERYLNGEIDFENGAHPKIVRCENEVNEKHRIVLAWRPFPEPYQAEGSDCDGK